MPEQWRGVPGWPAYEVSDFGRVRRVAAGRWPSGLMRTPSRGPSGYLIVSLSREGRQTNFRVSRLVLTAFVGPAPSDQHHAAHGNGERTDNRLANLRWATPLENQQDTRRHERERSGRDHPLAKLTPEIVAQIKAAGRPTRRGEAVALARSLGVHQATLTSIWRGRSWAAPAPVIAPAPQPETAA